MLIRSDRGVSVKALNAPSQTLLAGLIGLGNRGKRHLDTINRCPSVIPAWIYDPQLADKREINGIPIIESIQECLDYKFVDFVILSVPHKDYIDVITQCAKLGVRYILKEKPLACSLEEAMDIGELEKSFNVRIAIAAQRRHSVAIRRLKDLLTEVGPPIEFSYHYYLGLGLEELNLLDWREQRNAAGGGAVIDMGYHAIDLIAYLFGKPRDISCSLRKPISKADVESGALVSLYYDDTCGTIHLERFKAPSYEELRLEWRDFSVLLNKKGLQLINSHGCQVVSQYESSEELLNLQISDFINFVLFDDSQSVCRVSDAIDTMEIIDNCYSYAKWVVSDK